MLSPKAEGLGVVWCLRFVKVANSVRVVAVCTVPKEAIEEQRCTFTLVTC